MSDNSMTTVEKHFVLDYEATERHYNRFKTFPRETSGATVYGHTANLARQALEYFQANLSHRERALLHMSRIEETSLNHSDLYDCVRLKMYLDGLESVIAKNAGSAPPMEVVSKKKWEPVSYRD